MATPVIMPKFGMAQEDGTILRWLKNEGDEVERGDVLLEVQTDKIDMEVEAPVSGVLRDVRYGVDTTVPVTTVIAMIADPAEEARIDASDPKMRETGPAGAPPADDAQTDAGVQETRVTPVARRLAESEGVDLSTVQGTGADGRVTKGDVERAVLETSQRVAATPAARRIARESGIDLHGVEGSGPGGRVQAADVATRIPKQAAPTAQRETGPAVHPMAARGAPIRGKRRTIATRLSQSWQAAPHIFLSSSVDMSQVESLRSSLAGEVEQGGAKLTVTVIVARAVVGALLRRPKLNAWLRAEGDDLILEEQGAVNLGVAVALDDGLIVPVVRDAQTLGLLALAQRMGELTRKARSGALAPDEVASGTFSLSNLGMYPVEHFTAIINPPQVAILACGQTQMQPVWDGTQFHPRPVMQVTLSADHRAVDGAEAALFLAELKSYLEQPQKLLL